MKKLLIILLLSSPAWAVIGTPTCQNGTSNAVNTVANGTPLSVTAGDFVWAAAGEQTDGTGVASFSDDLSNTWNAAAGPATDNGGGETQVLQWVIANSTGSMTVTANWGASKSTQTIIVCNASGIASSSTADTSVNIGSVGFVTSLTSGVYTTTNANDLLIYCVRESGSTSAPVPAGSFVIPTNGSVSGRHYCQYWIVSATQASQTTSLSWTSTARASGTFLAVKATSSGGGGCCGVNQGIGGLIKN